MILLPMLLRATNSFLPHELTSFFRKKKRNPFMIGNPIRFFCFAMSCNPRPHVALF